MKKGSFFVNKRRKKII